MTCGTSGGPPTACTSPFGQNLSIGQCCVYATTSRYLCPPGSHDKGISYCQVAPASFTGYLEADLLCPMAGPVDVYYVRIGSPPASCSANFGNATYGTCGTVQGTAPLASCVTGSFYAAGTASCQYDFGSSAPACSTTYSPLRPTTYSLSQLGISSTTQCPASVQVCP